MLFRSLACLVQFILLTLTGLLEIGLNAVAMDLVFAEDSVSLRSLFVPFRENTDTCIKCGPSSVSWMSCSSCPPTPS